MPRVLGGGGAAWGARTEGARGEDARCALPEQEDGAGRGARREASLGRARSEGDMCGGGGGRGGPTDPSPKGTHSLGLRMGMGGCQAQGQLAGEASCSPSSHPAPSPIAQHTHVYLPLAV